jgi:hypothetical protein
MRRLVELAASFWVKACAYDNVPRHVSFIFFSRHNPYIGAYNRALGMIIRSRGKLAANFNVRPYTQDK